MPDQAKGSAAYVMMDTEASYKTAEVDASKQPVQMHFNSQGLTGQQNLIDPETLRGDRNPVDLI